MTGPCGFPESPSVLIVRLSSMGDLLRFLPLVGALKTRHPGACVDWVVGSRCGGVVEMCVDIDEVIVLDADPVSPLRFWPFALMRSIPKLRRRRYDAVIDCHSTVLSAGVTVLSSAARRLGIDKPALFKTHLFPYQPIEPGTVSPIDYHLSVLRFFGIEHASVDPVVRLDPGAVARQAVRELLTTAGVGCESLVGIHHDTSLESKRWPAERFSTLANRLRRETGTRVLVIGEKADARFEEIRSRCEPDIVFQHGLSVRELAATLEACDLVIANESGPLHLAAALGRPNLGLFGPSDPSINTPYGGLHRTVRKAVPCSPCFKGFEFHAACPLHTLECLNSLQVDDALIAAKKLLAGPWSSATHLSDNPGTAARV